MPDMPNIPPQIMQALQQQQQSGAGGADVGQMLQQLMAMSPDEVAQVLQQMFGLQVDGEDVHAAAENWVDQAASDASGEDATQSETAQADEDGEASMQPPTQAQPSSSAPAEVAEPAPDDEEGEGEAAIPANARPTAQRGGVDPRMAAMAAAQGGGGAMPTGGGSGMPPGMPGAGSGMDELISAAMMERAVGNPNAMVPAAKGGIPTARSASALPKGAPPSAPRDLIAQIYRGTSGGKSGKTRKPSAKPRTSA